MTTVLAADETGLQGYAAPATIEAAVQIAAAGPVTVLAGGTDLMPQSRWGGPGLAGMLVNVRRVPDLGGIVERDGMVRLGALVTVTEVLESALLAERARVLVETADQFASEQLRNMATLGGNICNASPAGDMIIPLLLLDAEVELTRWSGKAVETRVVPLAEFFTGPGKTVRRADEILTAIQFPLPPEGFVGGFRKFGPRPALEVALAAVGVALVREGDTVTRARAAFGAGAPTPMRGLKAEAARDGRALDGETIAATAAAAADEVKPITDVRASDWYRRHLVRVLTEDLLSHVAQG